MISLLGWRDSLRLIGLFGLVLGLTLVLLIRNKRTKTRNHQMLVGLRIVLRSRSAWAAAIYGMTMYIPLVVIGDLWGVSFLERSYGIDESTAAPIIASMFIGLAAGSPVFALCSDMIRRRWPLMFLAALSCLAFYYTIIYTDWVSFAWSHVAFFLVGFFFGGKALSFAVVVESLPKAVSGVAVGFANTIVMTSGIVSLPLVGWLLDSRKGAVTAQDMSIYTIADFRYALTVIPVSIAIAILMNLMVKETYPGR